jgi:glycosyltransferase involved in cell wall biosynthesis
MLVANVKQFRATFYPQLEAALAPLGIRLQVIYSDPSDSERTKGDSIDLAAPLGIRVPRHYMLNERLLIQLPSLRDLAGSDLLIIVQATGYLLNYPLLLLSALRIKRVAFWGHGYNRQGRPASLSERIKRWLATNSAWWFAYTAPTARYLSSLGFPPDRITTIENAIDTRQFQQTLASVTMEEIQHLKSRLNIAASDRVALYCGSLYAEKRVDFLVAAALRISALTPDFRLLVVGSGQDAYKVVAACESSRCVVYAGPMFGRDKATCFRMAEVFLHPGAVGLGVLDSFAAALPFVTTSEAVHGPEIDYLQDGVNGLMVTGDDEHFAQHVVSLLHDPNLIATLSEGARRAAARYTVENMIRNVRDGIISCLARDSRIRANGR